MRVFRVGGSVRDEVMGLQPKDLDFVVVGATPEEMIEQGFVQVGADFPVFLNEAGEEFALARTERKVAAGHRGFETKFDPTVTLEDDLVRRDVTMNAMAVGPDGEIIDPFNGRADILEGVIRHVSTAFAEDPLRVLRVARFAARFDFTIAPRTMDLMKSMVRAGELNHLTPERVWKEASRAIMEKSPQNFFNVLKEVGALEVVFGQADIAFEMVDDRLLTLASNGTTEAQRWAGLFFDVGDDITDTFIEAQSVPNEVAHAIRFIQNFRKTDFSDIDSVMVFLQMNRLWGDQSALREVFTVLEIITDFDTIRFRKFEEVVAKAGTISFDSLSEDQRSTLEGPAIGEAIADMRREIVVEWVNA